MKACLELQHVTTQFGSQLVHDDVSLTVNKGEVLGIVGGSGSGKSVLLKYMMGLHTPQKGKIVYHHPFSRNDIGVLFQTGALMSSLTVLENIMLPLTKVAHVKRDIAVPLAMIKLKSVGLGARDAAKYPASLSGGMIKRVGLARALILEPPLLFLDEPTAGLDPLSANEFDELILELRKNSHLTVIMVTHDLDTLAMVCDRIGFLVDKKIYMGKKKDITHMEHPQIRAYFQGQRGKRLFG